MLCETSLYSSYESQILNYSVWNLNEVYSTYKNMSEQAEKATFCARLRFTPI